MSRYHCPFPRSQPKIPARPLLLNPGANGVAGPKVYPAEPPTANFSGSRFTHLRRLRTNPL
jgi:hypothetical protein